MTQITIHKTYDRREALNAFDEMQPAAQRFLAATLALGEYCAENPDDRAVLREELLDRAREDRRESFFVVRARIDDLYVSADSVSAHRYAGILRQAGAKKKLIFFGVKY